MFGKMRRLPAGSKKRLMEKGIFIKKWGGIGFKNVNLPSRRNHKVRSRVMPQSEYFVSNLGHPFNLFHFVNPRPYSPPLRLNMKRHQSMQLLPLRPLNDHTGNHRASDILLHQHFRRMRETLPHCFLQFIKCMSNHYPDTTYSRSGLDDHRTKIGPENFYQLLFIKRFDDKLGFRRQEIVLPVNI